MLVDFPGGATLLPTRAIRSVAVGQTQVAVLHGLGHTPGSVVVTARSAGQVWQSAAPNAYFVYLTADAAGRSCDLLVG
jgi:glyoxylase-like metal-dependent hydrolase (beta-lactamase superfamily II)